LQQTLQASSTLEHLHGSRLFASQNDWHLPLEQVPLKIIRHKSEWFKEKDSPCTMLIIGGGGGGGSSKSLI